MDFLSTVINVTKTLADQKAQSSGNTGQVQKEQSVLGGIADLFTEDGAENVATKFREKGLGDQFDSWVGKGENKGVSSEQITDVFGSDTIGKLANKVGLDQGDVSKFISELMPDVVNQATPDGKM